MSAALETHQRTERDEVPSDLNLRRYARTLTGRAGTGDDLVQDALERAIARFAQFRRGTNLRAWLSTILHNASWDQFRRAARRAATEPPAHSAGRALLSSASCSRNRARTSPLGRVNRASSM